MVYKVLVDKELTCRLRCYIKLYGLKCNPFVYHTNIERLFIKHGDEAVMVYCIFVEAYVNAKMYFYMERKDLERALMEKGYKIPSKIIEVGLKTKVLTKIKKDGEVYIGLNPNLSPW